MRSIAQASKDAVSGADETLWQACMERITGNIVSITWEGDELPDLFLEAIRSMSSDERKLYGVEDE